jgi:pimeloyl-ACP methyl ester carboxylesterase
MSTRGVTEAGHLRRADLGGPVAYADFGGEGRPLVLVHGLGCSHLTWMAAARGLSAHGRVLALDLVGAGQTPRAGRAQGLASQRTLLHRFLTEVVREPAVLVGHSMGGLLALAQAAEAPRTVERLVLVAPAQPPLRGAPMDPAAVARFALHAVPGLGELALWAQGRRGGARGLVMELLALGTHDVSRVPADVVEAHVAEVAARMQARPFTHASGYLAGVRALVGALSRRRRVARWVDAVRAPTLLVHGRQDRLVPFGGSEALARRRADWSFLPVEDAGHAPMLEDGAGFARLLGAWLAAAPRPSLRTLPSFARPGLRPAAHPLRPAARAA